MKPRTTNSKGPLFLRMPETKLCRKKWSPIFQPNLLRELPPDHAAAQVVHEVAELRRAAP